MQAADTESIASSQFRSYSSSAALKPAVSWKKCAEPPAAKRAVHYARIACTDAAASTTREHCANTSLELLQETTNFAERSARTKDLHGKAAHRKDLLRFRRCSTFCGRSSWGSAPVCFR